ncbi:unnamed protein product [Fraxinus pennsylvanica]|uniref:Jacalin-type lectin domain-containing protein n=1 Tax=Fraxinus pennsylvanica TaxID=56036 RepID=A0AAD1ZA79_9LAMI|nr:unnamed protein product [Fraxinus pennsylvanica]
MENSSMVKIGPVGNANYGNMWDEKGRTEIVQIFVSHDTKIHSLQFLYANDDGELVLSDKHGRSTAGDNFNVESLNYPSEYITSVSGKYDNISGIKSITFGTNLGTHGPFGETSEDDKGFMLHLGSKRQFGGFHGTADSWLRSIGIYVKLISTLASLKEKEVPKLHCLKKDDINIM